MYVKLEKFQINEWRDGKIYQTKSIGFEWFSMKEKPETYSPGEGCRYMYVETGVFHFGSADTIPK